MSTSENNKQYNGYFVMDTCCFLNYIEGRRSNRFDYNDIAAFIKKSNFILLITPYTLYECIQSVDDKDPMGSIKRRGEAMLKAWDFWVLNMNKLVSDNYTFEFGPDFVFGLNLGIGTQQEFLEKRNDFRIKTYLSLIPKLTFLAQLIASIYLLVSEQKENGLYSNEFLWRQKCIFEYFPKQPNFRSQMYTLFQNSAWVGIIEKDGNLYNSDDGKTHLSEFVQDMVIQILAVSYVMTDAHFKHEDLSLGKFNDRVFSEYYRLVTGQYERKKMVKMFKEFKQKNKQEFSIDSYVGGFFPKEKSVHIHLFKSVVNTWFSPNGAGKKLINTIIDYINLGVVELLQTKNVIYMTEEDAFVRLALTLEDDNLQMTKLFYQQYYKK